MLNGQLILTNVRFVYAVAMQRPTCERERLSCAARTSYIFHGYIRRPFLLTAVRDLKFLDASVFHPRAIAASTYPPAIAAINLRVFRQAERSSRSRRFPTRESVTRRLSRAERSSSVRSRSAFVVSSRAPPLPPAPRARARARSKELEGESITRKVSQLTNQIRRDIKKTNDPGEMGVG